MPKETRSTSFVVRLRAEPAARTWWGEVQHVESGERIAFRDHDKLLEFLRRHLARITAAGAKGHSRSGG